MATWSYNGNDTAIDTAGNVLAGRIFTIWTAETAGSQLTSTLRTWAGSTVTAGQIASEADGRIRFKETSGTYPILWMKAPDNTMYPVYALEAVGTGSGGGASLSTANTWTASQNLSAGASVPDNTWTIADTAGLQSALDARVNPVFRGDFADEASMLALSAGLGDTAWRTDTGTLWLLVASPASTLANWREVKDAGARARANHTGTQDYLSTTTGPRVAYSTNPAANPVGADANTLSIFVTDITPTAIPPGPAFRVAPLA